MNFEFSYTFEDSCCCWEDDGCEICICDLDCDSCRDCLECTDSQEFRQ